MNSWIWGILFQTTLVYSLTFTNTPPSSCDDLTVKWTGGQPPFNLLIISSLRPITNYSIPSGSFQNNEGQFTTQLKYKFTDRVAFTMSDATGETAGGITPIFSVAQSVSGQNCDTTSKVPDFFFSLDNDLEECKPFPFSQYDQAVQPVVITAFIAGGESFKLFPPPGDSFLFQNDNLTAGSSVFFAMTDAKGRDGGTSDIRTVRLSSTNAHCAANSAKPTKKPVALIAGVAVGTIVAMVLVGVAALLIYRWKRRRDRGSHVKVYKSKVPDLLYDPQEDNQNAGQVSPIVHEITPFDQVPSTDAPPPVTRKAQIMREMANESSASAMMFDYDDNTSASGSSGYPPARHHRTHSDYSVDQSQSGTSMYTSGRGRVIVHTDIAEDEAPMELPPQYSDSRAPIPGLLSSNHPPASSSASSSSSGAALIPEKT